MNRVFTLRLSLFLQLLFRLSVGLTRKSLLAYLCQWRRRHWGRVLTPGVVIFLSPPNSERLGDCRVGAALVWSFKRVVSRAVGDFEAWTDERCKRQTNPNIFIPNAEQLHPAFAKIIALMFAPLVHLEIEPLGSLYKNGFHVFFFIFTQWVIWSTQKTDCRERGGLWSDHHDLALNWTTTKW